jgi:hypothetical protein
MNWLTIELRMHDAAEGIMNKGLKVTEKKKRRKSICTIPKRALVTATSLLGRARRPKGQKG